MIHIENFVHLTCNSNMESQNGHNNSIFTTIYFDFADVSILQLEKPLKTPISCFYDYKLFFASIILRLDNKKTKIIIFYALTVLSILMEKVVTFLFFDENMFTLMLILYDQPFLMMV